MANIKLSQHVDVLELTAAQRSSAPAVRVDPSSEDDVSASRSLLNSFLYPLSVDTFMKDYWNRKALHIKWNDGDDQTPKQAPKKAGKKSTSESSVERDRFAYVKRSHLHGLDVAKLLQETASDNIFVWIKEKASEGSSPAASSSSSPPTSSNALNSFELDASNPAQLTAAQTLHNAGASLYFRSPPAMVEEYVAGISEALGMNFSSVYPDAEQSQKGEIEVFLSRKGHLTDWHFDFMHNFTLQLKGKKRWLLKRSTIPHPIRGATPHYRTTDVEEQQIKVHSLEDPDFSWSDRPVTRANNSVAKPSNEKEEYDVVELGPGDCFWHPAGIWHRVECTEDSISVNISLIASDWSSVVLDNLRQKLWSQRGGAWRQAILINSIQESRQFLASHLQDIKNILNNSRAEDYLPNALYLPRKKYYLINNEKLNEDNSQNLCSLAALSDHLNPSNSAANGASTSNKKRKMDASAASASNGNNEPVATPAPLSIEALSSTSRFRVNPFAVVIAHDHSKKAHEERLKKRKQHEERQALKEKERNEAESDEDEDEEMDEGDDEEAESDNEDEEALAIDAAIEAGAPLVGYVLHFSFGNESLDSAARVAFHVTPQLHRVMETIRLAIMDQRVEQLDVALIVKQLSQATGNKKVEGSSAPVSTTVNASKKRKQVGKGKSTDEEESDGDDTDRVLKLLFFLCQQGAIHLVE